MKVKEITQYLESIAPLHLQENYDNSGLIVGHGDWEVNQAIVSLDATPEVIEEAIARGCEMVISHHPIVFSGLKKFNGKNYIERAVMMAVKNDIALYAIHTNLDNVLTGGVNQRIAEQIGLENVHILKPKEASEPQIGAGAVGDLGEAMPVERFFSMLKSRMKTDTIRHTKWVHETVSKVAICGGSGSFLLEEAKRSGAEVFITGDYKYHQFFDADGEIIIADIGHFESEQFTIDLLCEQVNNNFSNFAAHCTKVITNPIQYF